MILINMGRSSIIYSVIILGIAMVIMSIVLPLGLNGIATATLSTDLDAGVASMFTSLLPIIVMFAVVLGLIQYVSYKKGA